METLRNYTQHRGLVVYNLSISAARSFTSEKIKHVITPQLSISEIVIDPKLTKVQRDFLTELMAKGDLIDIKPFIREYIQSIYDIHVFSRQQLKIDYEKWIHNITATHGDPSENNNLFIYIKSANGEERFSIQAIRRYIERCKWLVMKNNIIDYLPDQYVSSEFDSNN